jgi:hypothetical protein|uniref:hypothetical protein n=1 Tax=unclassified Variovorax TaxID=663243 RepID=UPI000D34546C
MTAVNPSSLSISSALPAWPAPVPLEPESHAGGWEIHYRLARTQQMFSGFAEIHCNGQPHCELPIFEPQANALASIDLLREQCLAWIEARNTDSAGRPALAA